MITQQTEREASDVMASAGIPDHMHGGIYRYFVNRIEPGSFLMAVLENNLRESLSRADHMNKRALSAYIRKYVLYETPDWGT